jgi:hypothetical protein
MAHWNALLAAVVKVALCQAGSTVHGRHGSWLLPQPLEMHHTVLLQQLLVLLQTHVSELMLQGAGQSAAAAAAAAASTVEGVAAAAAPARSILRMLLLPTSELMQRFTSLQKTPQQTQQPTQLDILRCLRQRACDLEAQLFVQRQLHTAGGSIMQLLFGLPAQEAVQVYASCSTVAGLGASTTAGAKSSMPLRAALGSSSGVPNIASGCIYLSANYLAFTDLLSDCSSSSSEGTDAIAKRVAKAVKQAQAGAKKAGQPATTTAAATAAADLEPPATTSTAAAGPTGGSSASGGLATKSWWKSSLLPSSGSSNSSTVPAAAQQTAPAPGSASTGATAAAAAAAALAADTTLLFPTAGVARLDKVYYRAQGALALTMLQDRSSRVLFGFESAAVRDKLHDAVRLAVMGSNTALDRNLRCCEETVGKPLVWTKAAIRSGIVCCPSIAVQRVECLMFLNKR